MKSPIRPITDHVVVKQEHERTMTPSGLLHMPDTADGVNDDRFPPIGVVLAIGPDVLDVQPGDRVYFTRRGGTALIPDRTESGPPEFENVLVLRCPPRPVTRDGKPWQGDIVGIVEGRLNLGHE